jgi:pimeloyl-ACP methyl ester carboxylesterase
MAEISSPRDRWRRRRTSLGLDLGLLLLAVGVPAVAAAQTPITMGQTLSGALSAATPIGSCRYGQPSDRYAFTLASTTVVTLDLVSAGFDTYLCLYNSGNSLIGSDDNYGVGTNSRYFATLATGTYYVEVSTSGGTGAYQLSLNSDFPPATPIAVGQTLEGTLSTGAAESRCGYYNPADRYELNLAAATTLTIEVSSAAFDAHLCILNSSNAYFSDDDNSGAGTNARWWRTALPTGRYFLEVSTRSPGNAGGAYTISVKTDYPAAAPIALGQTLGGTLSPTAAESQCGYNNPGERYELNVAATTTLTIDVTSAAFDTELCILNSSNTYFSDDDNSGPGTNARWWRTALPTGRYFLEVSTRSPGNAGGAYTISVKTDYPAATPIGIGQTLGGTLASTAAESQCGYNNPGDRYELNLATASTLTIDVTSAAFDTELCVLNSSNTYFGDDDNSGPGTNARWWRTSLPTGRYFLEVSTRSAGNAGGAYSLTVKPDYPPASPIALGQTVSATLSSSAAEGVCWASPSDRYEFSLAASTQVVLNATSGAFDARLCLMNAQNAWITYDDNSGGGTNARITRSLTAGRYFVDVNTGSAGLLGGAYAVSLDDAAAPPRITIGDASVTEGNTGTTNAVFTVGLSKTAAGSVSVAYATAAGTATATTDYTSRSGTLTFPAGTTSQTIAVPVVGDTLPEGNETFAVNLSNATGGTLSRDHAVGTILDDDGAPNLSITDVSVSEGNSGVANARFTVTLSAGPSSTVTVAYATTGGTATPGVDFQTTSGTLSFGTGVTSRTIDVPIKGDVIPEPSETFLVQLSAPTGAVITRGRATGTIVDDDSPTASGIDVLDPACAGPACAPTYLAERTTCRASDKVFLVDDLAALASASTRRSGAATDGVTVLLLRVAGAGPVTFSLKTEAGATPPDHRYGRLSDRNGCSEGLSVTVPSEGGYAFAAYRAPIDYPAASATTAVNIQITASGPGGTSNVVLALRPPPVVLVHGIWSDAGQAWTRLPVAPPLWVERLRESGFEAFHANYGSPGHPEMSVRSFDPVSATGGVLLETVGNAVDKALGAMRRAGVASCQVDVVGHSMGGLLARALAAPVNACFQPHLYRSRANFLSGDFHKIITVGTPHRGSDLANWLVANRCRPLSGKVGWLLGGGTLESQLADSYHRPMGDAIFELQTTSPALGLLDTSVPTHTIVASAPLGESPTEHTLNYAPRAIGSSDTIDSLLGGDGQHDTIVGLTSQAAGLIGSRTSTLGTRLVHADLDTDASEDVGETESVQTLDEVRSLLRAHVADSFGPVPRYAPGPNYHAPDTCATPAHGALAPPVGVPTLLPTPGQVFRPGETVIVTFSVAGGNAIDGVLIGYGPYVRDLPSSGPMTLSFAAPRSGGRVLIHATTYGPGPENYEASTEILVLPAESPLELEVSPSELRFDSVGQKQRLTVNGIMPDGSSIELTSGAAGTLYAMQSGTANVASVSADGEVTAEWDGQENLTVHYGALSVQVPVTVAVTNHAPHLDPLPTRVVAPGETVNVPLFATDSDGNRLTLSGVDLPAFASVVDNGDGTGSLHVQPGFGDLGSHQLYVAVADDGTPALGAGQALALTVAPPSLGFYTLTPCRVVDTRNPVAPLGGPSLVAGATRDLPVAGQCGIPATAKALSLNVTVTASTATGHVRLFPGGSTPPNTSTLNYLLGQTRANNAVVPLSASGVLSVLCAQASGSAELIVDVNGYFE